MIPLNLKDVCSVMSAGPTIPQKMWTSSQIFRLPMRESHLTFLRSTYTRVTKMSASPAIPKKRPYSPAGRSCRCAGA